ncbi:epiphycan isoform X2 [Gouania willdenowi]|uniref:epiphycan isoform X2 n=1 Tax=Gouania willdenowi TaxID=441366 RepID=UPI0010555D49|nr:epiphycan isoform X2 [Gouania willdenowi]
MRMILRLVFGLFVLKATLANPRFSRQVDLDTYDSTNYDVDLDNLNLENQDNYDDYEDGLTIDEPQIEIETLAPPDYNYPGPEASLEAEKEEEEEMPLTPQLVPQGSGGSGVLMGPDTQKEEELPLIPDTIPHEASGEFTGASGTSGASGDIEASGDLEVSGTSGTSGVSGSGDPEVTLVPDTEEEEGLLPTSPETPQEGAGTVEGSVSSGMPEPGEPDKTDEPEIDTRGMPTCLLCTCLGGSVYCDDLKLDSVPPLPKDTTHFYARYNRITKINKSDFASMNKLKRIDLTANEITSIDEKAFMGLPELEELVIRENHVTQLPALPETMTLIDASQNEIGTKGLHQEAFKDMASLLYLYMTDNHIDYIPVPLPNSLRSLHLQRNNIQMMHEDTFCNLKDYNYIRNALEDIRLDGNPINLSRTPQAYVCLPRIPIGDLI